MNRKLRKRRNRIIVALILFAAIMVLDKSGLLARLTGSAAEPT